MMQTRTIAVVAMLVTFVSPFLGATARAEELVGSGEWQSLSSEAIRGKWSVTLTRIDSRVDGTLTLAGSNVFAGGRVAGTVDTSSIVLGVMSEGNKQASFSGKLDGETISGEWEAPVAGDHGVWYGELTKK